MPVKSELDEDHHDEEDLPRDADGGVRGEAHEVADQGVIHDALDSAEDVGEDGGPRELPDRAGDGAFDDRAIEGLRPRWKSLRR